MEDDLTHLVETNPSNVTLAQLDKQFNIQAFQFNIQAFQDDQENLKDDHHVIPIYRNIIVETNSGSILSC